VTGTTGRLLVAEPMLGDPNFDRTVVLVVQHTTEGALGLVLNRPTDVPVSAALPQWDGVATDPGVLHVGGPVEEQSGWCLARAREPEGLVGFVPVVGDLGLVDLELDPEEVAASFHAVGGGPRQRPPARPHDAWLVADAEPDDPFRPDGPGLWKRILARQGGPIARLAHFPPDPSLN
jgi:putative transcriptional regulator